MKQGRTDLNQVSEQVSARQLEKIEKIKLIAYRLWVARREGNIAGDAESDYFQAEQILESNQHLKRFFHGEGARHGIEPLALEDFLFGADRYPGLHPEVSQGGWSVFRGNIP